LIKIFGACLASRHLPWSPHLSRVTAPSANAPMRLSLKRIEAQPVLDQTWRHCVITVASRSRRGSSSCILIVVLQGSAWPSHSSGARIRCERRHDCGRKRA